MSGRLSHGEIGLIIVALSEFAEDRRFVAKATASHGNDGAAEIAEAEQIEALAERVAAASSVTLEDGA